MDEETIIVSALSTLTSAKLSDLTHSVISLSDRRLRRISAVISSPILFSLTLHRLHSLSLPNKTLLIARHLLISLELLTQHFEPALPHFSTNIKQRDLDAVLLLLLLCEVHQENPEALSAPVAKWQVILSKHFSERVLTLSGIGSCRSSVLLPYIEMLTRCRRFIRVLGGGGKEEREVAVAVAAVVALPSVEVVKGGSGGGGPECVICKEEMREGRDVCELPCEHLFHWICILPWLKKTNTCPCCRLRLPTDDVFGEIERLWEVLVKMSLDGEYCM